MPFTPEPSEYPGWEPGWRRYVEHDCVRVVMHGKGSALFICFLREDDSHDTHMVTENTPEAERVFGEICEAIHQGVT